MMLSAPHSTLRLGRLVGGALLGAMLVAAGTAAAYLTVATPFVSTVVPVPPHESGGVSIGLGVGSFALIAAGAMLVAGTSRLAMILTALRRRDVLGGAAARALASISGEVAVAEDVRLPDGPAIPELVIGAFGAAVVHTLPSSSRMRRGVTGWELRTSDGWQPADDPLEMAAHDADRVRHWLNTADLDFVVHVYAAVVAGDQTVERSPTCAVVSGAQIPVWIASLPRQRTLTVGRRGRLVAMSRSASGAR